MDVKDVGCKVVGGSYGLGNRTSGSIKSGKFLDQLSNCQHLRDSNRDK
jgi:hypothetical protein